MKHRRREAVGTAFLRGVVVSGLLSTLQDRREPGRKPAGARKVARHALQGGAALAAGTAAAQALRRSDWSQALAATMAGAAALYAVEQLLAAPAIEEISHGEEEEPEA
jgi:hypothetical protein